MKIDNDGILISAVTMLIILFAGDPDIGDAITHWIMK